MKGKTRARRCRRLWAAFVALALLVCACPSAGVAASDGMLRVRLTRLGSRSSLSFTTTCAYYVDGNTARPIPAGAQATVDAVGGELFLTVDGARTALGASCTLARGQGGARGIRFTTPSSNLYCGDLLLSVSGGNIVPILRIYIEDYLYGVVGYEMSDSWPLEALKAQAVAARNYALRCISTRSSRAYHVVDTSTDQVFRGYDGASSRVIQAVDGTRNMALYAGSSIASCYYSASNGGQTEATRNVWGGNLSYSVVRDDPYDLGNPSSTVKAAAIRRDAAGLDARLLQALLDGAAAQGAVGASLVSILDIEPHTPKYAAPSRLYTKLRFTIEVTGGRQLCVDVDTYGALEDWYGLSINSSSNETVYVEEGADAFTVSFRRWGHGVGMSQRGAQAMAQQGMSFRDILSFYYPGTQLRTLSLADTTGSGLHDGGAAETPLGQVVCVSGADVYASASAGAEKVGSVPAGALVDVYEAGMEWSRIGYGAVRGWAQTALFALPGTASPSPSPAPTAVVGRQAVVSMAYEDGRLYLRSGPSTDTDPVTTVRHGDTVTAYATSGEWTAVETAMGQRGYLKSKYLVYIAEPTLLPVTPSPTPVPSATPIPSATPAATPSASPTATPAVSPTPTSPAGTRPYGSFARVTLPSSSSRLDLHAAPSTSSAILGSLEDGEYVEILADSGGWARVETTLGRVGYVQEYYLRRLEGIVSLPTAAPTATPTPKPTATPAPSPVPDAPVQDIAYARVTLSSASSRLNLRAAPSTSSAILTKLDDGDIVRVLAANGSWVRIEASGRTGYVQSRYLAPIDGPAQTATPTPTAAPTPKPTATPRPSPEPDAPVQDIAYARVTLSSASSRLNLRAAPSTSSAILTKLDDGDIVRVLAANGSWVRVEAGERTGYVQSRYLAPIDGPAQTATPTPTAAPTPKPTATPAPSPVPDAPVQDIAYARVTLSSASSRLNLRAAPSTSSAILTKLDDGDIVRVLAANGSWVRVEAGGRTGYVQSRYLARLEDAATPPASTPAPTDAPAEDMAEVDGEVYAQIHVSASGGSLHVRQGPSTQTPSVTTVRHGSQVQVLAMGDEWARVRTKLGNVGYIKEKYLVLNGDGPADEPAQGGEVVRCDLKALTALETVARSQPDADAPIVATIPAGTGVYVKAYNDDWAQVFSLSGSSSGFVLKAHLRLVA